jgi:hypothetical protein
MSTQLEANHLNAFLQDVHQSASSGAGLDAAAASDTSFADAASAVAVGTVRTISIPITNGQGEQTSDKVTTWGVTIKGTGTILAPSQGSWNITVTDLVAGKPVFQASGLAAGTAVPFSYKTGFQTQMRAVAQWSEGGSTTLELELDTNH